jgi:hypothetical protein
MPLRLLLYIARIYEKITGDKDLYREKRIPLPLPEFIVLYNGTAPYPDEGILKLSNSFSDPSELGLSKPDFLPLELVVKVYNINKGRNEPIIKRCKTLEGYSDFIAKVREYEGQVKIRDEAMKMAINDCIKNDILRDFLEVHASEVINMLLTEWNWDDALAVREEEGREEGREEGEARKAEEIARNALGLSEILCKWHLIFRTEPVHCQIKSRTDSARFPNAELASSTSPRRNGTPPWKRPALSRRPAPRAWKPRWKRR